MKKNYIKDKNFILLFFGSLTSGIGSKLYGFGISIYLLDLTGLATSMTTYIAIWSFTLFLVTPIASTFTDRWRNKVRVLYMTDIGRGVIYIIIGVLLYFLNANKQNNYILFVIYTSLILIAFLSAFFSPASTALLPQIVEPESLVSASSLFQLIKSLQNIIGLALGSYLYVKFGIVIVIIVNGISFIISGISEMNIHISKAKNQHKLDETRYIKTQKNQKPSYYLKRAYKDLKEATVYLFKEAKPVASVITIMVVSLTLLEPYYSVGTPYIVKEYLSFTKILPEYILAICKSTEAIGVILMSFLVSIYIAKKIGIYKLLKIASVLYLIVGVSTLSIILVYDNHICGENTFLIATLIVSFITGVTNALVRGPFNAAVARHVDPNKIGKIVSLMESLGGILMPVSLIVIGILIDSVSIYYAVSLMVIAYILIFIIINKSRHIKKLET